VIAPILIGDEAPGTTGPPLAGTVSHPDPELYTTFEVQLILETIAFSVSVWLAGLAPPWSALKVSEAGWPNRAALDKALAGRLYMPRPCVATNRVVKPPSAKT